MNSDPNQKLLNFLNTKLLYTIRYSYFLGIDEDFYATTRSLQPALWNDIVLMLIRNRIRISMLMPIQVRIRIVIGTMLILMRIPPQDLHKSENQNFFITFSPNIASLQRFVILISVELWMAY